MGSPEQAAALEVWPQPASAAAVRIRAAGLEGQTGHLYAATGRLITSFQLTGQTQSLPSFDLASGLYLLRIGGKHPITQRLLIR
ncbi:hypothetical protein GGR28_001897 [Lewinella aquimaris]|uniref:Secretion system C-terminal sorting domain-containing protein n=1 Tax=Neolewinella aquimaris TaxID=1835722 RepID=A0A840E7N8_9BACT|nr:T9SS type A sorting domain-containing protein [Neolewinella aquimaris]MBB4079277.1 hypothetical protein [Neolewinella aquimaris]